MARCAQVLTCFVFAAAVLSAPVNAVAQKSGSTGLQANVPLADVMALARPYPNLQQEIRLALITAGVNRNAVTCSADRLDDSWALLRARAVGPYRCKLGGRGLQITTAISFFDAAGHKLSTRDPSLHARAVRVAETRLAWSWQ